VATPAFPASERTPSAIGQLGQRVEDNRQYLGWLGGDGHPSPPSQHYLRYAHPSLPGSHRHRTIPSVVMSARHREKHPPAVKEGMTLAS